jgi:hypothetical protein
MPPPSPKKTLSRLSNVLSPPTRHVLPCVFLHSMVHLPAAPFPICHHPAINLSTRSAACSAA